MDDPGMLTRVRVRLRDVQIGIFSGLLVSMILNQGPFVVNDWDVYHPEKQHAAQLRRRKE